VTLFEYLASAYSLVLSFAAMRLIEGLAYAFDPARRYWVHVVFVCSALLSCLSSFWIFWSFRDVAWDFSLFLLALMSPGVIYFIACTLVPRNAPDVESWREYLLSVRVRYFLAVACFVVVAALISTLLGEVSVWSPLRAVQAAIFLVAIVGIRSDDERILAALAVLIIAVVVVGLFLLRRPAPLVGI
jgi:hypothetical protein